MTEIQFSARETYKDIQWRNQSINLYLFTVKTYSGIQKRVNLFTSILVTSQLQVKI